ncbi:GEVED domain-containing protein, partial [bacterium]
GDAPAPYPTLRSDPGTTYRCSIGGMMLGYSTDAELDGQPSVNALGDDDTNDDDEDGVTIYFLTAGEQGIVYVQFRENSLTYPNGLLDAWIDFNQNGAWEDEEKVINSQLLLPDNNVVALMFDVPSTAEPGDTYGRFVLTAETYPVHLNGIPFGEVEDHQIRIFAPGTGYQEHDELPLEFSLAQNHPNPFNPSTTIKYTIKQAGLVTLTIYDVRGKEVQTLVNEVQSAGIYHFSFNADEYDSGIYVYKLQAGDDFSAIKKMILLR